MSQEQKSKPQAFPWSSSANWSQLKFRANLLKSIRHYFDEQGVLEVQTPLLSQGVATDPQIEAFKIELNPLVYLQTSPEFAMKRLLCAHGEDIYQICPAFRQQELGAHHNPEFTMLEWYRVNWTLEQLIEEVLKVLALGLGVQSVEYLTYQEAFLQHSAIDPLAISLQALNQYIQKEGLWTDKEALSYSQCLDLVFSHYVAPKLGRSGWCVLHEFPVSMAALAKLGQNQTGHTIARRFEVFFQGKELANGYDELQCPQTHLERFKADIEFRKAHHQWTPQLDERLLAALQEGLPQCVGVAMGLDRLLMLSQKLTNIAQTMAFDFSRA